MKAKGVQSLVSVGTERKLIEKKKKRKYSFIIFSQSFWGKSVG